MSFWKALWLAFIDWPKKTPTPLPQPVPPIVPAPQPAPVKPEPPAPTPTPMPKYLWDTPANVRHSIRVICDESGLTVGQKNDMCATIQAESGGNFNTKATNKNYYKTGPKAGQIASTDWGLCQWNDFYHGKEMPPDVAMNDPEKAVRLMAHYWKIGESYRTWWVAYANGLYRKYL